MIIRHKEFSALLIRLGPDMYKIHSISWAFYREMWNKYQVWFYHRCKTLFHSCVRDLVLLYNQTQITDAIDFSNYRPMLFLSHYISFSLARIVFNR